MHFASRAAHADRDLVAVAMQFNVDARSGEAEIANPHFV
jgi:hypothetical protein